jgi:hypothetical protein
MRQIIKIIWKSRKLTELTVLTMKREFNMQKKWKETNIQSLTYSDSLDECYLWGARLITPNSNVFITDFLDFLWKWDWNSQENYW